MFDGVTAGGMINCHAAQAFAEYSLRWLGANQSRLGVSVEQSQQAFSDLFLQCTHFSNNPGGDRQAEGGSATGVVASVVRRKRKGLTLVGASVGDAACFVVPPDAAAEAVTKWHRTEANPKDSGGEMMMSIGVQGSVTAFARTVTPRDLIVLATDGLTDNVLRSDMGRILPLIICSSLFQTPTEKQYPARYSRLPTYKDIAALCHGFTMQSLLQVSPANAVRRITNYLRWVTRSLYKQEQQYYALELAVKKISDLDDTVAALAIIADTLRRYPLREESAASGSSGPLASGAVASGAGAHRAPKPRSRMRSETGEEYDEGDTDSSEASDNEENSPGGAGRGGSADEPVAGNDSLHLSPGAAAEKGLTSYNVMRSSTRRYTRASLLEEVGRAANVRQMVDVLQNHLKELRQARKLHRSAGKTDDAMVVIFRPLQKRAL
jgi:hypothetical protein